jgi:hypothetical protein
MAKSEGTRKLEAVLDDLDPSRRSVADALRGVIRAEGPDLAEDVKWNAPSWGGQALVFCLMVYDKAVHLGLFRGAELAAKHPLVVGTGKSLRHVKVPTPAFARTKEVRAIVRAAIALDATPPPKRTKK